MKKFILFAFITFLSISFIKAQQINNSGFEDWQNLGAATEKPVSWNGFKNASGNYAYFVGQQIKRSSVHRPGSSGQYSILTWAKEINIGFIIVANGSFSTGQFNVGSMTPADPSNYTVTHMANPDFYQVLNANPDSIAFWVKFKPISASGDSARCSTIIHDAYDFKDPEDANSTPHKVAEAIINFPSTGGSWIRIAKAFDYCGPASDPQYIMATFATNKTPAVGHGGDSLYIDDVELIYNDVAVKPVSFENSLVYFFNNSIITKMQENINSNALMQVFNINGQLVGNYSLQNKTNNTFSVNIPSGVYIYRIINGEKCMTGKFVKP